MDVPFQGPKYPGLEHLICAALADTSFAHDLITDPADALARTPSQLQLTEAERQFASSITDAADIYDYATKLYEVTSRASANGTLQAAS